uniref:Neurotransmitter-gated ion-channel transmembrane domain-containing protein n=1 Tax=Romanomermis culicivorax TaxID=13658 RepID=A0A915L8D7_ROMCU
MARFLLSEEAIQIFCCLPNFGILVCLIENTLKSVKNQAFHAGSRRIRSKMEEKRLTSFANKTLPGDVVEKERREKVMQILNSPQALKAFSNVCYIAEMLKKKDKDDKVDQDWKFISMVVDRLFLFAYIIAAFLGVAYFLLHIFSIYDGTKAIDPLSDNVESA